MSKKTGSKAPTAKVQAKRRVGNREQMLVEVEGTIDRLSISWRSAAWRKQWKPSVRHVGWSSVPRRREALLTGRGDGVSSRPDFSTTNRHLAHGHADVAASTRQRA